MGLSLENIASPEGLGTLSALFVGSVLKHVWLRTARASREKLYTKVGQVASLHLYPIKACGEMETEIQSAAVTRTGLLYDGLPDRCWMLLRGGDKYVNMRTQPRLTFVTSKRDGDWMIVTAPDMAPLRLPLTPDPASFQRKTVCLNDIDIDVLDCGQEAAEWFSRFLAEPVRLVHSRPDIGVRDAHDMPSRGWDNASRRGDESVFAYLTPYLLTTSASLADLNQRLTAPVSPLCFRPNIVVQNSIPFDEDNWEEIRIGKSARFHYVEPCRRCIITTVDPKTGERDPEMQPLSTLKSYRQKAPYGNAPLFGAYIAVDSEGPISVGDPVFVIRREPSSS